MGEIALKWKIYDRYPYMAQFRINTGFEINTCSFCTGCQFFGVAWTPPSDLSFWDSLCAVWNKSAGELASGDVASVWTSWIRSLHCARKIVCYMHYPVSYIRFPVSEQNWNNARMSHNRVIICNDPQAAGHPIEWSQDSRGLCCKQEVHVWCWRYPGVPQGW